MIEGKKTRQSSPRCVDFSPLVSFFLVPPREPSCFLASICLAWPLDSCSVCQLVASGTLRRGEFAGKKRGRGPAGALQTHQFLSSTPTVLQHSKEKSVSLLIIVLLLFSLWWKECWWKSRLCLPCIGLRAGSLYCSGTVFIRCPILAAELRLLTSVV